ncbi:MAG: hypothetical protein R6X19_04160 [Kiritimatiellia bacterium]
MTYAKLQRSGILAAAAGWTLLIPLMSLLPPSFFSAVGSLGKVEGADKIIHSFIYGIQTALLIAAWPHLFNVPSASRMAVACAAGASAYGFLMELLQRTLTVCREFSWGDVLANTVGALIAAALAAIVLRLRPPVSRQWRS